MNNMFNMFKPFSLFKTSKKIPIVSDWRVLSLQGTSISFQGTQIQYKENTNDNTSI